MGDGATRKDGRSGCIDRNMQWVGCHAGYGTAEAKGGLHWRRRLEQLIRLHVETAADALAGPHEISWAPQNSQHVTLLFFFFV